MKPKTLDLLNPLDDLVVPPLCDYLRAVDEHLTRLTCGLLTRREFDVCWAAAWRARQSPAELVRLTLGADGFVVSRLPTPAMRQLAAQREVRDG